ncbi:MAG: YicC family protein [Bacteroidales bacterium]|nr:YicC family protein [Bacteroidales bacterium]
MIQSMTGYGKADAEFQGKKIHVEIKSLNSKALDLTTRVAQLYREKEMEMRAMIQSSLERGKVEFSLWVEKGETVTAASINGNIVAAYAQQIKEISETLGWNFPADPWSVIVRLPEITQSNAAETLSEEEWGVVRGAVQEAIDHLVAFRKQEGVALAAKFAEKLDNIAALMEQIVPFEQSRVAKIRERLEARLEELKGVDYDKNRLEQELIYYIEKLDISEEKQRLANHLNYFRETMQNGHGQGKKLGFIAQEMGREINTTGSKSNQAEMQNIVVKMKDELEQIKEQVLNVM